MSKDLVFDKEDFIRLMMSNIQYHSSSPERAKEYLSSQGLDVDKIISNGLSKITELQNRINSLKSIALVEPTLNKSTEKVLTQRKWSHSSVLQLIKESGNSDPIEEIKTKARDLVVKAFELGWEGPPYNPIQLAKYFNIDVVPNDSVIDARILPITENSFQIQYNPFQRPTRLNFSIAHEIAHTLFSDCAQSVRNREKDPSVNRELEQLCNAAAAEIQLPYAKFSNDANNSAPSMEGLIELATKYKASLESVFIRYTEVIDRPCAVLIGIFQTDNRISIDYIKSSRLFPIKIPDNFEIPSDSKAYECISPGWTSRETASWEVFNGQNYNIFSVGISPYRRDNKPRVGILILPTEEAPISDEKGKVILEFGDATKPRGGGKKIIAQVVNTSSALGRGFGYSLAKNYPIVKEKLKEWSSDKQDFILGNSNLVKINENLYVFQMLAQKGFISKNDEVLLKYTALKNCLIDLREVASDLGCSIHMPAIGAGQAKGNWDTIIGMIHDELINYNLKVNIYLLPGKPFDSRQKSNLTLFKEKSTWETEKLF